MFHPSPRSAVNQLQQVARFSGQLQASQVSASELSADRVEEFPWLAARRRAAPTSSSKSALGAGVRAAADRALRHQGSGPGEGLRVDRGLQLAPAAFRAGHDVAGQL
jgi:hypothetical protein